MIDRTDISYTQYTYKYPTPDGTVYVVIAEEPISEKPTHIFIHLGKSGTLTRAWSEALASIINLAISGGARLEDIANGISNITTDRVAHEGRINVRSGPEGIALSFLHYSQMKAKQTEILLKVQRRKGLRWNSGGL